MLLKTKLTILTTVFILLAGFNVKAQWDTLGTRGFSTTSNYLDMLIVSDTPYVCFAEDAAGSFKASVMKWNGTSWAYLGGAGLTSGVATELEMDADANGNIYLLFKDGDNSDKATVMKWNGTSWSTVGTAGFSVGSINYTDFAVNTLNNDTLYAAYTDYSYSPSRTIVMKYSGSSWSEVGGASAFTNGSDEYSLAFDSDNNVYLARNGTSHKAAVYKYNGSSWSDITGGGLSSGSASYLSLAEGKNDTLFFGFNDASNSSKISVMRYDSTSWDTVGTYGLSAAAGYHIGLTVDTAGTAPYVVYRDASNSYKGVMKKFDGSSWIDVGTQPFTYSGSSQFTPLFTDNALLYVCMQDQGASNKTTVMQYVAVPTWNGSTWENGTPSSSANAIINSSTAPTSFTCNNLSINSGFALNTGTSNVVTIHGNITNSGNGVTGTGTLTFSKSGAATITGDTIEHSGTIIVESGCTLTTNSLLRLLSDTTQTGTIGNSAGTISGNVYAQRANKAKKCYRLYAHPFSSSIALSQLVEEIDITGSGGATNGFTTTQTNNPSAYWFDPTAADTNTSTPNSGWTAFTSANTASWDQYEVLLMYLRGAKGEGLTGGAYSPSASTFEAFGAVNQGTQVVSVTKGSSSSFGVCGNPFPCGVQMQNVSKGSNVGANYYVWDASSGVDGAWVTNAFSSSYVLQPYSGFFTTLTATDNITFEEQDKASGGSTVFKGTAPNDWVELLISDSTTKWDRLLIHFDDNAMQVQDNEDAKKLYNPNLDFYTLSKDGTRLAIDVRPYDDTKSIPLGLNAYNRYNKYVIKTGDYDIPAGTKLYLHDKYLNKKEELKQGFEYWFEVTADTMSQGNQRFEINMVGKPTSTIEADNYKAKMQLIPNPAYKAVKVSFDKLEGDAQLKLMSVTGQVVFQTTTTTQTGSVIIPLQNIPAGIYIVELQSNNARFTEKLIKG